MKNEELQFAIAFEERLAASTKERVKIVIKEQYKDAYDILADCEAAGLIPGIIGPPGVGKTLLLRAYAERSGRSFTWITGDEGVRPSHLIGSFNPALVLKNGFTLESFDPGPLLKSMVYSKDYFLKYNQVVFKLAVSMYQHIATRGGGY